MSLFNLIHKSVVLKFGDCAKPTFDSSVAYVYRLTAVDGMGFLEIQEVRLGADGAHEPVGTAFWLNKDLIVELHEFSEGKIFENLRFSGPPLPMKVAKPAKPKAASKTKAAPTL